MKVVIDSKIPFIKGILEPYCDVVYRSGSEIDAGTVKDAQALIVRTRTFCNETLLRDSAVQFIATATIGFDHLDHEYLNGRGIVWQNAAGCNSRSVAEYVTSAMVNASIALSGKTVGIIGGGNVGKKVAAIAETLGMKTLICDPPRAEVEGDEFFACNEHLLAHADIVTLHVPLLPDTLHLANAEFFGQMRPGTVFINTSRGEVVDQNALKAAIRSGKVGHAVLDVWEHEPEIDRELLDMVNIGTPHIAGYSQDGKAMGTQISIRGLAAHFKLDALREFAVSGLPAPVNGSDIVIPPGVDPIRYAVNCSYNLADDDALLRSNPHHFEKIRENYRLRREFAAYTIANADGETKNILQQLGFDTCTTR